VSSWVLFIIIMGEGQYYVQPNSIYSSMAECFGARELFIKTAPKPKINYEAVCLQTDKVEMQ